jgi:Trypsin-co-occurring domain 1
MQNRRTMTELVMFDLGDSESVIIEVDDDRHGAGPVGTRRGSVYDLGETFERKLANVRDAAVKALHTFREANDPDEITLTFGVKLTTEVGAIIARTTAEGTFTVQLAWKRSDHEPPSGG